MEILNRSSVNKEEDSSHIQKQKIKRKAPGDTTPGADGFCGKVYWEMSSLKDLEALLGHLRA